MAAVRDFPTIKTIRTYVIGGVGSGGDYHNVKGGHWLIDSDISTPCSRWEQYRASRTSWGINVLGSFFVEIEATDGTVGYATGFGGPPACWLVHQHFERFLVGADPRNTNLLFEQMYRASMFYGRKGLPVAVISVIDLALWDLLGKLRNEPVYRLIGGATKERLNFYCTGPDPVAAKAMGFWGAKVPLPFCPDEGHAGLRKNVEFLRKHREAVGPDFPIMVDCYMSLNVPYTIELARECLDININWWEECLSPDDTDGFEQIKRAHPSLKFTTGEHEYSRFGFRKLIEGRNLDIIQPDVMWLGGMTELLKVAAMAAAYDIPVVPHASGPYSYHFVMSQPNTPFQEYLANSPDGKSVLPVFGDLFLDEPIPVNGYLTTADLDKPGFGLTLNPAAKAKLIPSDYLLNPPPIRTLDPPTPVSSAPSENDEEVREIISETPITPRTEPEKSPTTEAVAPTDKEDEHVTEEIPVVEAPGEVSVAVEAAIDAPTEETPAPEAEVEAAPASISDIPAAPTENGELVKQETPDQPAAAKEEAETEAAPAPASDISAAPKEIGELVKQETSDQPAAAKEEAEAEAEAAPVPIADILAAPKEVGELVKQETSDQTAAAKEEAVAAAEPAQTIPVATVVA